MKVFANDPFELVAMAFKSLYPHKNYVAYWVPDDIPDEDWLGVTTFPEDPKDSPTIQVKTSLPVENAVEIFAHELAHVVVGAEEEHNNQWKNAFNAIFAEYNRIGEKMFHNAVGGGTT